MKVESIIKNKLCFIGGLVRKLCWELKYGNPEGSSITTWEAQKTKRLEDIVVFCSRGVWGAGVGVSPHEVGNRGKQ